MAPKPDAQYVIGAKDTSQKAFESFNSRLKTAGKAAAVGGAAIAGGLGLVGFASIRMASRIEDGMREVNTLINVSDKELGSLQKQLLGVSKELGVAATDLVPGLYQALSAGVPKENVIDFLRTSAKAAVGGVATTAQAVDALSTAVNAFGNQGLTTEQAADSLFATVKGGKTTFAELAAGIGKVAPLASAAGVSFGEMNAAIATMTLGGFKTREAVTNLRAIFSSLARFKDVREVFGTDTIEQAFGEHGLAGVLNRVSEAAGGSSARLLEMMGSVEAVAAVMALTGANADMLAGQLDAQANSAGASNTAFEEMQKTFSASIDKIKAQVNAMMITIGSRALPMLTEALASVSDWFNENEPRINAALDRIGAALVTGGEFAREWAGHFVDGIRNVAGWVTALADTAHGKKAIIVAALAAIGLAAYAAFGPVGVVTGAVVAAIALIGRYAGRMDELKTDVLRALRGVSMAFVKFVPTALDIMLQLPIALQHELPMRMMRIGLDAAQALLNALADAARKIPIFGDFFADRLGDVAGFAGWANDRLADFGSAVAQGRQAASRALRSVTEPLAESLAEAVGRAFDGHLGAASMGEAADGWIGRLTTSVSEAAEDGWIARRAAAASAGQTIAETVAGTVAESAAAAAGAAAGAAAATVAGAVAETVTAELRDTNSWLDRSGYGADTNSWLDRSGYSSRQTFFRIGGGALHWTSGSTKGLRARYGDLFQEMPAVAMAAGGLVRRPTMALVGESGPEAVVPLSRLGGAPEVHVYIGEHELMDIVVRQQERATRLGYTG